MSCVHSVEACTKYFAPHTSTTKRTQAITNTCVDPHSCCPRSPLVQYLFYSLKYYCLKFSKRIILYVHKLLRKLNIWEYINMFICCVNPAHSLLSWALLHSVGIVSWFRQKCWLSPFSGRRDFVVLPGAGWQQAACFYFGQNFTSGCIDSVNYCIDLNG